MTTAARHEPVMLAEAVEGLNVRPGGRYVDATVGGGGHAAGILEAATTGGRLLGIDRDPQALAAARERLARYGDAVVLAQGNYSQIAALCHSHDFVPVDGVLFDLGVSSLQLDTPGRGFSFQRDEALDMRMDRASGPSAAELVNSASEHELARLIREYGEEWRSRAIARAIVARRPLATTGDLVSAVEQAVGRDRGRRIHPATLTFQALRIAVNQELSHLVVALPAACGLLAGAGARVVVIAFHSLEDRVVKEYFRRESTDCLCPPSAPVCVCGHRASLRLVTRRVRKPSEEERARNPRARSARMRIAEAIARQAA
ncbi:MAG: 16S rRNA (cytosine(1402)-N(4))-methyltransferase RsmH [Dehalococcoidia bacterium]|nr:16S rRNA (cytosine(1402)-N(4))-methyltransferase RsmH [Dehalococcoidia bacterium]